MDRPQKKVKIEDKAVSGAIEHILTNAFGAPVIFDNEPANTTMKGNTWGLYGDDLYIKFADGVLRKFSGTEV